MKRSAAPCLSCLSTAMPSSFGIMISSSTRSGSSSRTRASASSPSAAVTTSIGGARAGAGLAADGWRASTAGGADLRAGAVAPLAFFGGCGSVVMMLTAGIEDEEGSTDCWAASPPQRAR